jgi:hypothetical protein
MSVMQHDLCCSFNARRVGNEIVLEYARIFEIFDRDAMHLKDALCGVSSGGCRAMG